MAERSVIPAPAPGRWISRYWEWLWLAGIVLIASLAHGVNMFNFPYYETDEGTYMSQAWAVVHRGALAPYTYWYDHAPLGWLQLAAWTTLTGGFYAFGTSVDSGRAFMLVLQVASTVMVYRIVRSVAGNAFGASIATLAFALSAYGVYFHRRVLLDNIAAFWMVLSIMLLVCGRFSLTRAWLSATALGLSILSKEVTIFLVPVLACLVIIRAHRSQRLLATLGWLTIVGCIFSSWFLMALLRGELFPAGTMLGGTSEHVSLLETLRYQMSRGQDGGIAAPGSLFWQQADKWARDEPLLVLGGTVSAVLVLAGFRFHKTASLMGVAALSLWLFFVRGGLVLGFYLLPLLPLLAINLGLLLNGVGRVIDRLIDGGRLRPALGRTAQLALGGLVLSGTLLGYLSPNLRYGQNLLTPWTSAQSAAQRDSVAWARRNLSPTSSLVIDNHLWTDLYDPPTGTPGVPAYDMVHWHWKVDRDPEIRDGVFHGDWRAIDYVMVTPQMLEDVREGHLEVMGAALEHSTPIATFDTGGWPIEIHRVAKLRRLAAPDNPLLVRTWASYKARSIDGGRVIDGRRTTSEGQAYALLQAVYMDDRATFDAVWAWTREHLQVRGDGLLAWQWGERADGTSGVLDINVATDADQDAALALLFAARRWDAPAYRQTALPILRGIWEQATTVIAGSRVVVAGNWAHAEGQPAVVNPSYFSPYAYRIFATADPTHPWMDLVDSSYEVLARIRATPAHGGAAGLVPNWVLLDPQTGTLRPAEQFGAYASEFSYDASRLPWRLALDWLWFQDERARQALEGLSLPRRELQDTDRLLASYRMDGTPTVEYEAISMYAGVLGSLLVGGDHTLLHRTFAEKILRRYTEDAHGAHWGDPNNYYDQNWAWFATAMMEGSLGNLWVNEPTINWSATLPPDQAHGAVLP